MKTEDFIKVFRDVVAELPESPKTLHLPDNATDAYILGTKHGKQDAARFLLTQIDRFVEKEGK